MIAAVARSAQGVHATMDDHCNHVNERGSQTIVVLSVRKKPKTSLVEATLSGAYLGESYGLNLRHFYDLRRRKDVNAMQKRG